MARSTRRSFLRNTLLSSAAVGVGASTARAIEPIRRTGKPQMRLSLAGYSFRRYLDPKGQGRPARTLDDFIDLCATMPLDAVELTSYYFPQNITPQYLAQLKGRCTRLGIDVSGTAVRNDFCTGNETRYKQDIAHVKTWIEHTSRLGGKTIRIFAGNIPKGDTEEQARKRCVAGIEEVCEHASQFGVYVALENHGGITATADGILNIVRAVRSEWFGVNWDSGNFHTADPYADLARLAPYAVVAQVKTEMRRANNPAEEADMKRLLEILRSANFRGYVALEHEANEDPKEAVPRHVAALRRMMMDVH